jgi:hypothetical protein
VTVGRRAFLGIGCSVVPAISIGDDAIVGAGPACYATWLPKQPPSACPPNPGDLVND